MQRSNLTTLPVVGLLPMGGHATRLAPLPCSKELFPIGFSGSGEQLRPKAICQYLLESMRQAGVAQAYIVLRPGKWDIPAYLGDGTLVDMHLAYLMMGVPFGAPFTLDQAYPFVQDVLVAMGFPDIMFEPQDAYTKLLERQGATGADLVLGLFPTDRPHKADMVEFDDTGRIHSITIKPAQTTLQYTWIIALWTPRFTQFMHDYLAGVLMATPDGAAPAHEVFMSHVILAALEAGLQAETVLFPDGRYIDIGTPDDLERATQVTR